MAAAVQTGMEHTTGEIVFVQQLGVPLRQSDVLRLWELREDGDPFVAPPGPRPLHPGLIRRLTTWAVAVDGSKGKAPGPLQGGTQIIRRAAAEPARLKDLALGE